ncbi:MAG: DUF4145 domain-containing protein [Sedimentisphaerales bacterium]|nr:DUF4145 domain-containing protein [Sedimentisphaerales bacterium]
MAKKSSPPSIKETAFECPHCGAFTTQYWYTVHAEKKEKDYPLPVVPDDEYTRALEQDREVPEKVKQNLLSWSKEMAKGLVFLKPRDSHYCYYDACNLFLSECYSCGKVAVWVHDSIVFPHEKHGVMPNQDLPDDVIHDFEEARDIVSLSPRGAAALLRLAIQKLCKALGEKGGKLDDDISSLVAKGLNPLVQKSLDIVRVIGNEAVHPGTIDLNDNRDTADQLFGLINSIADQMITHPKAVESLYQGLPERKRKAIEKRNQKAKE